MAVTRAESERLRESFVDVLRRQAVEAATLAAATGDDPDLLEAVREMLERMQRTARALKLEELERCAAEAVAGVSEGQGERAVAPLIAACNALDPTAVALRPILVVGQAVEGHDPLVIVVADLAEAAAAAQDHPPLAIVAPVEQLGQLPDPLPTFPRYAWGQADDLGHRLAAAQAGANGYFAVPLDARQLAGRVRARVLAGREPDRVLLVGADDAVVGRWLRALHGLAVELTVLRARDGLLASLEEIDPTLVALADPGAADLAKVLRGHPDWWDLPRLIVAEQDPVGVVELRLAPGLSEEVLRVQVQAVLERAHLEREQRAVERGTNVLPRAALLRAAEREIGVARRLRQPLTAARLDLDEPSTLRRAHGSAAVAAALRFLARAITATVRATDVVGRVGEHGFGVLLPGAVTEGVAPRMLEVQRRFSAYAASDPRLLGVTVSAGLADTREAAEELLQRADRDRLKGRGGG